MLIVVLWATIGLVSVALLFGHSMLLAYRGADNDVAGHQADQAIEGAARYVESILSTVATPGLFPDPTTFEREDVPIGEASVWLLGRISSASSSAAVREFGLVDEASKLNLNTATPEMLALLPGMTQELADAIKDWRDTDEDLTGSGAESETYTRRQPAYACKNGPFESIEELALVNGATREILFGEDANLNGVLDPNEDDGDKNAPADNSDGKLDFGILEYVTVFSRESNKRSDGTSARINVTRVTGEVQTLLTDTFGDNRANELATRLGAGQVGSVLEFLDQSGMTAAEFGQIEGKITTTDGDFATGRVNVNTASEAVLACLPGIGVEKAAALVAARQANALQSTDITWVAELLDNQQAREAGPFITGHSFQVTADVAAVGRHGRGFRRTKFVIDSSDAANGPKIVYRRNLAPLGWALGSDVRQTLALRKEVR